MRSVPTFRPIRLSQRRCHNPEGEESDPQDIILIDYFAIPPIFGRGGTKAVPVEGVVGVLQVKSSANSSTVKSAVEKLASAKRILPNTPRYGFPVAGSHDRDMLQTGQLSLVALSSTKRCQEGWATSSPHSSPAYARTLISVP
jgi:hypothetical protein